MQKKLFFLAFAAVFFVFLHKKKNTDIQPCWELTINFFTVWTIMDLFCVSPFCNFAKVLITFCKI